METILTIFIILLLFIISIVIFSFIFKKSFDKYLDIKEMEIKNKKYQMFNEIDIKNTREIIDDFIEEYINRYAVNKFIANNIMYIRDQDVNDMIRNITKNIMLDISELYIYYISLLTSIDNDEDLIRYINIRVKNSVISFVADYNKARTGDPTLKL